jgi:heme/copper-type cytochrome/quinol oxidase subunit 2
LKNEEVTKNLHHLQQKIEEAQNLWKKFFIIFLLILFFILIFMIFISCQFFMIKSTINDHHHSFSSLLGEQRITTTITAIIDPKNILFNESFMNCTKTNTEYIIPFYTNQTTMKKNTLHTTEHQENHSNPIQSHLLENQIKDNSITVSLLQ